MAETSVDTYRLLVIGGSAGSLEVILRIVANLPFPVSATIVVVVHRKAAADSLLPNLLSGKTRLPVREVEDKEPLLPGTIYIAPADYHLLFENTFAFSLDSSEKVHYSRPSIDVTFESAATVFGAKAIGVLLSGANSDGAAGLAQMKRAGAYTLVQHPDTAEVYYMPRQAIAQGAASLVANSEALPQIISRMLTEGHP